MTAIQSFKLILPLIIFSLLLIAADTHAETHQDNFSCTNVTEIPQIECEALVAMYESLDGEYWIDHNYFPAVKARDWLETNTPCSWSFIECEEGHVTTFRARQGYVTSTIGAKLSGDIPAEIGNLPYLTELYAPLSKITSIPPEIGNMTNLLTLNLDSNKLSMLPPEIGNMTNLLTLKLNSNELSKLPDEISSLSNLTSLSIGGNPLHTLPSSISNLQNLAEIFLNSTGFTELPSEILSVPNLTSLSFAYNSLTTLSAEIGDLSNLMHLNLASNGLRTLPTTITRLTHLNSINLSGNRIYDIGYPNLLIWMNAKDPDWEETQNYRNLPKTFTDCASITQIPQIECEALVSLYNNTGGPNWSKNLKWLWLDLPCSWQGVKCYNGHISHLDLSYADLIDSIPAEIGNLSNLELLNLGHNEITSLPVEIGGLANLNELWISSSHLLSIPPEIGNLSNLTKLDFSNNHLIELPSTIGQLVNLELINLAENDLQELPVEIINLDPVSINLKNNQIQMDRNKIDQGLFEWLDSKSLRYGQRTSDFDCDRVEFGYRESICPLLVTFYESTDGPNWDQKDGWLRHNGIQYWHGVTLGNNIISELTLVDSSLSGSIPVMIGRLRYMTVLQLGKNELDLLPAEIGELSRLRVLDIEHNLLSTLPAEIGNLVDLEELWLGANQLTALPMELWKLPKIESLVISENPIGTLPPEVGNLTTLRHLWMSDNQFNTLPSEIGNLSNLTHLDLSYNQLITLPLTIMNLTELVDLRLGHNQLNITDEALLSWMDVNDPDWRETQSLEGTTIPSDTIDLVNDSAWMYLPIVTK